MVRVGNTNKLLSRSRTTPRSAIPPQPSLLVLVAFLTPHRLLSGVQPAPHGPRCGSDGSAIPRPSCTNNTSSGAHLVIVINYRHPVQLTCNNKRKKNNNQSNQMRFVCKIMAELFVTPSRSLIKQIGRAWRNDRPPAA
jgi:hypothetical protein